MRIDPPSCLRPKRAIQGTQCHHRASVRGDSLAERNEFELSVPLARRQVETDSPLRSSACHPSIQPGKVPLLECRKPALEWGGAQLKPITWAALRVFFGLSRRALQASRDWDHSAPPCATTQSWTGVGAGLLKPGRRRRITVASGPSLGFAVLKDLLLLLWPFVYSLSPPLFLLAPALSFALSRVNLRPTCGKLRAGMGYSASAAPISLRRAFSASCFDLNSGIAATVRACQQPKVVPDRSRN